MKCPNEDCTGWLATAMRACLRCGYEPSERDNAQIYDEEWRKVADMRNRSTEARAWAGMEDRRA